MTDDIPRVPQTWDLATIHDEHPLAPVAAPVRATLTGPDFPCSFVRAALAAGLLELGQIDPAREDHVAQASAMISSYLAAVDELALTNPRRAALKVLLLDIAVEEPADAASLCDLAWDLIVDLHEYDAGTGNAWPPEVPEDMNDPAWSYCLRETPIFVNMTSSALELRRSRNLGRPLLLVIQPTEGLHLTAPLDQAGDRIREQIRSRVDRYDGVPRSPALANAGQAGNSDWRQYWLGDSNAPSPWRPPQVPSIRVAPVKVSA